MASTAAAQDREYIRLLEKLLVGASGAINAEIADLRRQLARCDGPANLRLAWYQSAPTDVLKLLVSAFPHRFMEQGRVAVSACPAKRSVADAVYVGRFN